MADVWQWDETLFLGSAPYYARGRLRYPAGLADAMADALKLDGRGRLLDVGCGPGTIALRLAHRFKEVVGVDPDPGMLAEAQRLAAERGVGNVRWVRARAEELPAGLGTFRVATFSRSFHWMDRDRVAAIVREMLEPGGAFVQPSDMPDLVLEPDASLPHPAPPTDTITTIVRRYLGAKRRAGQGVRISSPDNEEAVLLAAGFAPSERVLVPGSEIVVRTIDDVLAHTFSNSGSAPHLFGDRVREFEHNVRRALAIASPSGLFAERTRDTEIRIWRKPR